MRKLFFDNSLTGHHSEYIGYLVDYLSRRPPDGTEYFFVVPPGFSVRFPTIFERAQKVENLIWTHISRELWSRTQGSRIRNSVSAYQIMHRYAKRFKVHHVCFLDFHSIKYGGVFHRTPYSISGILFTHFNRLETANMNQKWEYSKRFLMIRLLCLNPKIRRVFILNDEATAKRMNRLFRTHIFKMLPDPVADRIVPEDFDIYEYYGISRDRKIALHIGSLGVRKGTFEVLHAVKHFQGPKADKLAILLVGRPSTSEGQQVIRNTLEFYNKNSRVQLLWDDRFVSRAWMKGLFDQCHSVLMPYKNTEYSSGILGHSVASQKMVIATDSGLLGNLVRRYRLGILIDRSDTESIYKGILAAMDFEHRPKSTENFLRDHHPDLFAEMVIAS